MGRLRKLPTSGMPFGTACNKLRKLLLYTYVKKAGDNVCYVCKNYIETVDEFSIEHKTPWEGISDDLFWDLENIAFSHLKCNRPHRRRISQRITPEGMHWCGGCQDFLSASEFWKGEKGKLKNMCKMCHTASVQKYRRKLKESQCTTDQT